MCTVSFTGYRPEKMPFIENKKDEMYVHFREQELKVINRLIERGYTHFISGVAMGFDTWVAEDVLELQKKNKELHLECAIPCPDQDKKWESADQKRRRKILKKANESTLLVLLILTRIFSKFFSTFCVKPIDFSYMFCYNDN